MLLHCSQDRIRKLSRPKIEKLSLGDVCQSRNQATMKMRVRKTTLWTSSIHFFDIVMKTGDTPWWTRVSTPADLRIRKVEPIAPAEDKFVFVPSTVLCEGRFSAKTMIQSLPTWHFANGRRPMFIGNHVLHLKQIILPSFLQILHRCSAPPASDPLFKSKFTVKQFW